VSDEGSEGEESEEGSEESEGEAEGAFHLSCTEVHPIHLLIRFILSSPSKAQEAKDSDCRGRGEWR